MSCRGVVRVSRCPRCGEGDVPEGLHAHDICPASELTDEVADLRGAVAEFEAHEDEPPSRDPQSFWSEVDGTWDVPDLVRSYNNLYTRAAELKRCAEDVINAAREAASKKRGGF
jgi:hypothetical protein